MIFLLGKRGGVAAAATSAIISREVQPSERSEAPSLSSLAFKLALGTLRFR